MPVLACRMALPAFSSIAFNSARGPLIPLVQRQPVG
jgi:hypothetical protein